MKVLEVEGGDVETFENLLTGFENYKKDQTLNQWVESLRNKGDAIIGGNAETIHGYLNYIINYPNNFFDYKNEADKSLLRDISNALRDAYKFYQNYSGNERFNIDCSFNCFAGELDQATCACDKCSGIECCQSANNAVSISDSSCLQCSLFVCLIILLYNV